MTCARFAAGGQSLDSRREREVELSRPPSIWHVGAPARLLLFAALCATAGAALSLFSGAARATLPGGNGRIAFLQKDYFCEGQGSESEPCPPQLPDFDPWIVTMAPDGTRQRYDEYGAGEPSFSPGGRKLAWTSGSIEIASARGNHPSELTGSSENETDPAWSPSGKRLVFASTRRGTSNDDYYIHTVSSAGRDLRKLGPPGTEPDWSVTDQIVFEADDRIRVMQPNRRRTRTLAAGFTPSWSPDGQWIAFTSRGKRGHRGISLMRADGSQRHALTGGPWDGHPVWSPDGRSIAFVHRNRSRAVERIVVMRPDGSGRHTIKKVGRSALVPRDEERLEDLAWQPRPL